MTNKIIIPHSIFFSETVHYLQYNTYLQCDVLTLLTILYSTLYILYIYAYMCHICISVLYKKRGDVEQIFEKRASNSKKAKKSIKQIFPADSLKN